MQKWQYQVLELTTELDPGTGAESATGMLEAELDDHGAKGWELTSILESSRGTLVAFFKRPTP